MTANALTLVIEEELPGTVSRTKHKELKIVHPFRTGRGKQLGCRCPYRRPLSEPLAMKRVWFGDETTTEPVLSPLSQGPPSSGLTLGDTAGTGNG
jgi:hypothetical protein